MDYQEQLTKAKQFIEDGDHFLVSAHLNPDGDAVSSTAAVGWLLKQLNKSYVLVNADQLPNKFSFLLHGDMMQTADQLDGLTFERFISIDCADRSRIGTVSSLLASPCHWLNIDHHRTNDHYANVNLVRTHAAATCEVLYDLIQLFDVEWDKNIAECIYSGMLTDTGGFRYANTTPNVLKIASEMLTYGVDGNELAVRLLETLTKPHIELLKRALAGLSYSANGQIAWVSVPLQDFTESGAQNEDLEGLVNYPRNIEGVEVGLLFKEVEDSRVKVSMRSAGLVNVAEAAQVFNGGGHDLAAGCTVLEPMAQVIGKVVHEIESRLSL